MKQKIIDFMCSQSSEIGNMDDCEQDSVIAQSGGSALSVQFNRIEPEYTWVSGSKDSD